MGNPQTDFDWRQIDLLLQGDKVTETHELLCQRLAQYPDERKTSLSLLLVNIQLHGAEPYEPEIDELRWLFDLDADEKELIRRIFLLGFQAAEKAGAEEKTWAYQRLLRRLLLGQPLNQAIPITEIPSPKIAEIPLDSIDNSPEPDLEKPEQPRVAFSAARRVPLFSGTRRSAVLVLCLSGLLIAPVGYFIAGKKHVEKPQRPDLATPSPQIEAPPEATVLAGDSLPAETYNPASGPPDPGRSGNLVSDQLVNLRRAYARWMTNNEKLMGSVLIKLTVDASGKVVQADEVASRVTDNEFVKVVLAEARKWKFPKASAEASEVTVPLLFVPDGMDPKTVARWEAPTEQIKELNRQDPKQQRAHTSKPREPAAPREHPAPPVTESKAVKEEIRISTNEPKGPVPMNEVLGEYKTKRPVVLRDEPRFAATTLQEIDEGSRVSVLANQGDWYKIQAPQTGAIGYVRKEFVVPANVTQ
jgi:hypothetical protein